MSDYCKHGLRLDIECFACSAHIQRNMRERASLIFAYLQADLAFERAKEARRLAAEPLTDEEYSEGRRRAALAIQGG